MPQTRRQFLAASLAASGAAQEVRPNFLFVITDDQRWDMMGAAGHPFLQTPNIDRLAREGVRFSNAFVTTSLCSPALRVQGYAVRLFESLWQGRRPGRDDRLPAVLAVVVCSKVWSESGSRWYAWWVGSSAPMWRRLRLGSWQGSATRTGWRM